MALRQGFLQGLQFPCEYHSPVLNVHLVLHAFLNQKDERATYGEFKNQSCLGNRVQLDVKHFSAGVIRVERFFFF